jgi:hypothetical protein
VTVSLSLASGQGTGGQGHTTVSWTWWTWWNTVGKRAPFAPGRLTLSATKSNCRLTIVKGCQPAAMASRA